MFERINSNPSRARAWLPACWLLVRLAVNSAGAEPVKLHPENGHYFLFRDQPVVLVGSSEHYGVLINLDFDYIRYLDETRACGLNLVRVFAGTYRETTGSFNITDNTLAPAPGRSVVPWARSNIPGAADGGNKHDLTKWDPAFFYRLREFVKAAGDRDIIVEITHFSPFYDDSLWNLSPMKSTNNINGVGAGGRANCFVTTGDLIPYQLALVRKCAMELRDFDNIYHEVINEPYAGNVTQAWQNLVINEIVTTESTFPHRHLIAQNIANGSASIQNPNPAVSIFNFHYAVPNAALQNFGLNRAIGDDETGFATGEERKDFPYRRECWEFMLAGGGLFNHLDYSFTATREDGLASSPAPGGGGPAIRHQLGILRWFLEGLPLLRLAPQTGFIASGVPPGGAVRVIGVPGEAYGLYLRGGTQATLSANLPPGTYQGQWIDPRSGLVVGTENFTHASGQRILVTPPYGEDIALRLFGGNLPPPAVFLSTPSYNAILPSDEAQLTISAAVTVESGTLQAVSFYDGKKLLGTTTAQPYQIKVRLAKGSHVFRARVVTTDGRKADSPPIKATVMGPYHAGLNLNGPSLKVDGKTWLSQSEATAAGLTVSNAAPTSSGSNLVLYPAADPQTTILLNAHQTLANSVASSELGVDFPVPNGHYDIFLFLLESTAGFSRDIRVTLEEQTVAVGIGNQALGEWHKYGPYRVSITDGVLNLGLLRETKGDPKISGISIYRAEPPINPEDARLEIKNDKDVIVLTYPSEMPSTSVETSDDPGILSYWQWLENPAASFADRYEIPVPVTTPKRFFRLKHE